MIDIDLIKNEAIDFANNVCSKERLQKVWETMFGIDEFYELADKDVTYFIHEFTKDVFKRELDFIVKNDLKDYRKYVSSIARKWAASKQIKLSTYLV